ncbi:protein O-mannosyl-transferase TMTC1-like isoform X2 [Dysidea avara]|uniref:protein O-mannosyl-transferase TMTC1-like isoform X2 n=1 Tax=Dysidea avara TaxID=196820 RepID=UPI00331EB207
MLQAIVSEWTAYTIVALTAIGCYLNSLQAGLVHDDVFAIKDNGDVTTGTPLRQLFLNDFWGKSMGDPTSHKSYRPLTVMTFRLNYHLHGLEPFGYHTMNIILHCIATLLFSFLCWRVVFVRYGGAALLAGLLFATHPVHTEAVSGVVGRADVLACIFLLLSFLCYHKSLCQPDHLEDDNIASCHSSLLFFISLLLGSTAMLFKENGITSLGVCLCYDVFVVCGAGIRRVLATGNAGDVRPLVMRVLCVFIMLVVVLSWRLSLLHGQLPQFLEEDNPASFSPHLSTRVMTYSYLCVVNCWLLIAPVSLCYDWQMGSIPLVESPYDIRNIATITLFLTLLVITWLLVYGKLPVHTSRVVTTAIIFLIIPYLPASNLFVRVGFVVAERILYMPSIGYCILVVQGCVTICERSHWSNSKRSGQRSWPSYILMGVVLLLATKTINRNTVWYSRETLFRSGLDTIPHNAKIHYNYANYLKDSDQTSKAIEHYKKAVMLAPEHASSHNNLATLLEGKEAEYHYKQAVKYNPGHYRAFYNLGNLLVSDGRLLEGSEALKKSLELRDDYIDALVAYANLQADQGMEDDAKKTIDKAMAINSNNADLLNNYGTIFSKLGLQFKAAEAYQKAITINNRHLTAMRNLAGIYKSLGNDGDCEEMYKMSLAVEPTADAYHGLGALYFNTGRLEEAKLALGQSLNLEPSRIDSSCGYAQVLAKLGQSEKSIELLSQLARANPSRVEPLRHLGAIHASRGELQQAMATTDLGLTLHPDNAQLLKMKGDILRDMKEMLEAEKYYRKALKVSSDIVGAHHNLATLLHLRGAYDEARVHYEIALEQEPNNEVLITNMRKLERATVARH